MVTAVKDNLVEEIRSGAVNITTTLGPCATVPNHLAQLLALTAMEPPASFSASVLQNEQVKALQAVPPIRPDECVECVVRGQYTEGAVGEATVAAYREEPHVDPKLTDGDLCSPEDVNGQLALGGRPFYMRTGKRMRKRNTQIVVQFRNPPLALFRHTGALPPRPNSLVLGIQGAGKHLPRM